MGVVEEGKTTIVNIITTGHAPVVLSAGHQVAIADVQPDHVALRCGVGTHPFVLLLLTPAEVSAFADPGAAVTRTIYRVITGKVL